jgi:16S rRNA (cytosine1402-N4)-methyltransferase
MSYHVPVLFQEALDALAIKPDGIYVDATFGGGGHSRGILEQLGPGGKLFAFDQDADASQNLPDDSRIEFVPHNFRHLERMLRLHKVRHIDGLLADLGVSSHQFDEAGRGFSTRFSGPMDMRMDQRQDLTAAQIIQSYDEAALHKLFERFGEVTNARTLARQIVTERKHLSVQNLDQFRSMISSVVKGNPHKYLAQVFQALRMEVNDELGALKDMLQQVPAVLKPGGRVAIITFHSIEDRAVKQFLRHGSFDETPANPLLPEEKTKVFRLVTKKPVTASETELRQNTRSRSAKLRIAEKC